MLKNLVNWVVLTPNFVASPILGSFQSTCANLSPINYINESMLIENMDKNPKPISGEKDKHLLGPNHGTRYRIYIDNSGDTDLPKLNQKTNDYVVGKGKKETWYDHLINGLSINITDFANDKNEFLENYKAITFSYFYNFNFWNSKMGWSQEYGKHIPLLVDSQAFTLIPTNQTITLFEERDSSHDNNESAKLAVKQEWNGNLLTYKFYLSVSYYWKALSPFKHASFASFQNDNYSFTAVEKKEKNKEVKIGKVKTSSKFTLSSSSQEITLLDFDKEIKSQSKKSGILDSPFKTTVIFIQGYQGTKRVANTVYTFSIMIKWPDLVNYDSTLLLNGVNVNRKITTETENNNFHFLYEGFAGLHSSVAIDIDDVEMFGMEMVGNFHLPLIYV